MHIKICWCLFLAKHNETQHSVRFLSSVNFLRHQKSESHAKGQVEG